MAGQLVLSTEVPEQEENPSLAVAIIRAASNPQVDAAKMRLLWELKKEVDEQEAKNSFYKAMQSVQEELRPVLRDSKGQNSRYARLEAIDRAIRPIYTKHGFSLTFGARTDAPGMLCITCECMHRAGYQKHYELPGALDAGNKAKSEIQAVGSTVTYLRRYLVCLIYNVVLTDDADDDDGAKSGFISPDQVRTISDMILACEMSAQSEAVFCSLLNAECVEKILACNYEVAMTQLRAKHRARGGK